MPLAASTIECLEYMEAYLSPEEIKDTYLTREMIAKTDVGSGVHASQCCNNRNFYAPE